MGVAKFSARLFGDRAPSASAPARATVPKVGSLVRYHLAEVQQWLEDLPRR